jgi:trans-aconitate 2-methyltransferase
MSYLFKDTDLAAQRLQVLANVYAPASRAFLQHAVRSAPQLTLDLGCGPGYTTRLLAETTSSMRTIGLDNSEHFITLAGRNANEHITFIRHDVTQVPFPTGPADLIFCRMLLTHLRDPQSMIEHWLTQLRPQGLLLVEEVESIRTEKPLFRTYLGIVATLLEQQNNMLYIGPLLDQQQIGKGLSSRMSRVYHLPVSTKQAATMFCMNIPSWRNQSFVQEHYGASTIEQLEQELHEMAEHSTSEGEIEWSMRQIAYEIL